MQSPANQLQIEHLIHIRKVEFYTCQQLSLILIFTASVDICVEDKMDMHIDPVRKQVLAFTLLS